MSDEKPKADPYSVFFDPDHPNAFQRFMNRIIRGIDGPVTWFRETVVLPNRKEYPYYHRQYRRVPTIDECYEQDVICMYEANEQYKRDKSVDAEIVNLLGRRKEDCVKYEGYEYEEKCAKLFEDYDQASLNYFIKYGDLGPFPHAFFCYMKQKHRLVYERRKAAGIWNPKPYTI